MGDGEAGEVEVGAWVGGGGHWEGAGGCWSVVVELDGVSDDTRFAIWRRPACALLNGRWDNRGSEGMLYIGFPALHGGRAMVREGYNCCGYGIVEACFMSRRHIVLYIDR